ncbi:Toll-like receptor 13 Precursor [Channa argus]|uniref:Toll-like receptor 13 n=1 Tax=Channa argus TaxID=215402 RepID=A0A6G1QW02_CHAAH|nr:Toll-like receptor 13 Precursor [Channa argus]
MSMETTRTNMEQSEARLPLLLCSRRAFSLPSLCLRQQLRGGCWLVLAVSRRPWQPVAIAMDQSSLGDGGDDGDVGRPMKRMERGRLQYFFVISSTCLVLLTLLSSFTYHFLRWQLAYGFYLFLAFVYDSRKKKKGAPHQYDAFVSYNVHDEDWVYREMLPVLEGEQGWRLCLHHRDFQPGLSLSPSVHVHSSLPPV